MYRFIGYIEELLFLHDCVIIPEFGGFICNYKEASINKDKNSIVPPSKEIRFNRNLKYNDGLLVNWIVSREGVNYERALKLVQLFVEDIQVNLSQEKKFDFGNIGIFHTDRRLNVIFTSGENNLLADSYGMAEIPFISFSAPIPKESVQEIASTPVLIPELPKIQPQLVPQPDNWLQGLMKYGLAVSVIAGVAFISHVGFIYWDTVKNPNTEIITNNSSIQGNLPGIQSHTLKNNLIHISPDYDYVEYDPASELE